mmetsp:Transcript_26456/g.74011  ORF Transcript_26456/g.74011 Transcript_26456/m.74011 type:complete len:103 (+) Transcript_26456:718-1026(+)
MVVVVVEAEENDRTAAFLAAAVFARRANADAAERAVELSMMGGDLLLDDGSVGCMGSQDGDDGSLAKIVFARSFQHKFLMLTEYLQSMNQRMNEGRKEGRKQ